MLVPLYRWFDRNVLELGRELRLSYLPPLMVYMAAGISGLTGIVGTFFVKEYLGLSAAFLAALGFWAGIPWALKMPIGHLVDLLWRWKSWLVYLGASLIAVSLLIMVGLIGERDAMVAIMPAEAWYVFSVLLAPVGYVIQDAVADAMTVEAVPRVDEQGKPIEPAVRKLMHTTMQTLGRVAIIGGSVLVAAINLYLFSGVRGLPQEQIALIYQNVYLMALVIPVISVLGVVVAALVRARDARRLARQGYSWEQIEAMTEARGEPTHPNWWILGGSLAFVVFTLSVGLNGVPYTRHAGRYRNRHFCFPCHPRAGTRRHLVDDRRTRIRSAFSFDTLADWQCVDPCWNVPVSPLHGRAVHCLRSGFPHGGGGAAGDADCRHVLRPA